VVFAYLKAKVFSIDAPSENPINQLWCIV